MQYRIFVLFFIVSFSLIPFDVSSQGNNDSLLRIINSTEDNEVKASVYITLGRNYLQTDVKEAEACFDKAIQIGSENHLSNIIADGYKYKGIIYVNSGEHLKSIASMDTALEYYQVAGNKQGIANVLGNMGNLYHSIGDNAKSLQYQLICLQKREELNDTAGMAATYNGIANVYLSDHINDKALVWYQKCLEINRKVGNKTYEVSALCNIGIVLVREKKLEEAMKVLSTAMAIADSTSNNDGKAVVLAGISSVYIERKLPQEALKYLKESLEIFKQTGNQYKLNEVYGRIGEVYANMYDYQKSIDYFKLFLEKSRDMGMKQQERQALSNLSECYSKVNNIDSAFKYLSEFTQLNDTLNNEEKIRQVTFMQAKFETERKEKENIILESKLKVQSLKLSNNRYLMLGLGSLLVLSLVSAFLIVRQNKLRSAQSALQLEQKLLRTQMNPHFIFNSLTTIESFIYENQPKEAGRYLSDFARLMRLILENSMSEYIPLSKEIKTLEYYLVLQKLRLEDHLNYRIITDGIEDADGIEIPPMLTQPFIENAIEHGFRGISKEGFIEVTFKLVDNDKLQVQITDNGKGINSVLQKEDGSKKHKSMAMQITRERLQVLNRSKKQKVTFEVTDISDKNDAMTGTRIIFTIPLF